MFFYLMVRNTIKGLVRFHNKSASSRCCQTYQRYYSPNIRAERINVLRKKYESFLEEDRKRKERNEYILGQLDKMRTCTTIVQKSKMKPAQANLTKLPIEVDLERLYLRPRDFNADVAVPLLQKITENYILIPKRRRPLENTEETPKPEKLSDDSDWKTKYEILNILKKAEKEESVDEITLVPRTNQPSQQFNKRIQSFDIIKDVPERDSNSVKIGKDLQDDDKTVTGESQMTNEIGHQINEVHIKSNEILEYDDENGLNPAHIYYPREDIGKPLGDIPTETEEQYPIEIINVEQFTPHDDVILKDGDNINPKIIETMKKPSLRTQFHDEKHTNKPPLKALDVEDESETKHISSEPYKKIAVADLVISSDIKSDIHEFKSEQDQPAISEPQNTLELVEHSFNEMPEKEDQQHYYTGPHENPESVFISEHEETSSPYDQSYAQQYMAGELKDNQAPDIVTTVTTDKQWEVSPGIYEGYENPAVFEGQEAYTGQEVSAAYVGKDTYEGQENTAAYEGQEAYTGQEVPAAYEGQEAYTGQEVPADYVGQETYEGQEHPAAYEGRDAYTGQEVPASYVGQETYEGQEHPAAYEGQEAYTGQEVPAAYVGQETYEGQEHPAAYEGQEAYPSQEVPAAYTGQDTYEEQIHPAAYEGEQTYPSQEVPAAYKGHDSYEGQDHPAAYEGQQNYTGEEVAAAYAGQKTYEGQEHPAPYEGQEAYPGQEVPAAYTGQDTYERLDNPAAYEGQEAYTGQEVPVGQGSFEMQEHPEAYEGKEIYAGQDPTAAYVGQEIPAAYERQATYEGQQDLYASQEASQGREQGQEQQYASQEAFKGPQGYEGDAQQQLYDQTDIAEAYNDVALDKHGLEYNQDYPDEGATNDKDQRDLKEQEGEIVIQNISTENQNTPNKKALKKIIN